MTIIPPGSPLRRVRRLGFARWDSYSLSSSLDLFSLCDSVSLPFRVVVTVPSSFSLLAANHLRPVSRSNRRGVHQLEFRPGARAVDGIRIPRPAT